MKRQVRIIEQLIDPNFLGNKAIAITTKKRVNSEIIENRKTFDVRTKESSDIWAFRVGNDKKKNRGQQSIFGGQHLINHRNRRRKSPL